MIAIVLLAVLALGIGAGGIALYMAASPWALLSWPAFLLLFATSVALQRRAERLDERAAADQPPPTPPRGRHRR